MYRLAVVAIFKNETLNMTEWLRHHIWQGVEHFYMIDNGSTDEPLTVLDSYIKAGLVTLFNRPERYKQVEYYNEVYQVMRKETEWLAVIDLDEFLYGEQNPVVVELYTHPKIKQAASVHCPWINFAPTTGDHPASLRLELKQRQTSLPCDSIIFYGKYLVQTRYLAGLQVHWPMMAAPRKFPEYRNIHRICLNHYQLQSWHFYSTVKMTRGDVMYKMWDAKRTRALFDKELAFKTVYEPTLADLVKYGYPQSES